jgi:putative ABC transport system permease protein
MFRNNFKIAWRNIFRNKTYTAINVLGLSLGICACIAIYTVTSFELSFDRFHPGKERIYRVMGDVTESTGDKLHFAKVPFAVLNAGRNGLSGLEEIAGIIPYHAKISIPGGNYPAAQFQSIISGTNYITTVIAEPQYFDIFKYDWLAGNASTALGAPYTVVLTERKARQYFGSGPLDKMIGRQIIYDDSLQVRVSGIIKDWDKNSDLAFTDFVSVATLQSSFLKNYISKNSWSQGDMSTWTFAKLGAGTTVARVNSQMADLIKTHADKQVKLVIWLEPISAIHFNGDVIENTIRTAHLPTLYSLMGIALFILILGIVNFINLSTAQSIQRAKEAGVRKVLGSNRSGLVFQFLTESFLLVLFSVFLAIVLVKPTLIGFGSFIPNGVSFHLFKPSTILFLVLVIIFTTLFAGLYPAQVLSSYPPAMNLKGSATERGSEKWLFRKSLIVFQFAVSLVFIIGSMVIAKQLRYTREKDLGFNSDSIITLETSRSDSLSKIRLLAQKIREIPGINKVALQWLSPMTENSRGMKLKFKSNDLKEFGVTQVDGNEDYIPLYQIKLLAGRNLTKSDSVNEFVINEKLSELMGNKLPEDAVGKTLYWNDKPYPVVGVVADFHTKSLHDLITPLCIINRPDRESSLAIKLASKGAGAGMIKSTLSQIEKAWKDIFPSKDFNFRFYDQSLALLYGKDKQTAILANTSMAISIFISCMGLFGLALFTVKKRAKEISIRKILGASVSNIAAMLSWDFIVLIIIALFIASPVAWYFMNQWLQGFAYRIHVSGWVFISAGMAAIFIALITVSFQSIKAAIANPVNSLRSE